MKRVSACTALCLVLAFSGTVFGAVSEGQFSVSPMIGGYSYNGGGQHLATAPMYSLRGGYGLTDNIGVEAGLDYSITNSTLVTDKYVATFKYGVEGLYHFMPTGKLVPFLAVGVGGYNLSGPSVLVSRKEMGFMDYGAGVKYSLNDSLALRADVRHVLANSSAFEYTMGVIIPFGGAKGATRPLPESPVPMSATSMPREEPSSTRVEPQEKAAEDKAIHKDLLQETPAQAVVAAPEQIKAKELSPEEKLEQLKKQYEKDELERIETFKADWEKKQHKPATPQQQ